MPTPDRHLTQKRIEDSGLVAVIRASGGTDGVARLVSTCKALLDGGVEALEITMTSPGALAAIEEASQKLGDKAIVGVGSVLDPETARMAILAGAQFVFAPNFNPAVIQMAHRYSRPVVPGALTPTEIMTAWEAGADMIKVFPANHFGPRYFKDILAPMPQVKLTPTGGVNLETVKDWIGSGASALGVGSALVKKDLIEAGDWQGLTALAAKFRETLRDARLN